jgi:hypothetical protein
LAALPTLASPRPNTFSYLLESEDFAGIFGKANANNKRTEMGTITITISTTQTRECGYMPANRDFSLFSYFSMRHVV